MKWALAIAIIFIGMVIGAQLDGAKVGHTSIKILAHWSLYRNGGNVRSNAQNNFKMTASSSTRKGQRCSCRMACFHRRVS